MSSGMSGLSELTFFSTAHSHGSIQIQNLDSGYLRDCERFAMQSAIREQ